MTHRAILVFSCAFLVLAAAPAPLRAAPPIFDPIAESRALGSVLLALEGSELELVVSAQDPDGDELRYWAEGVPGWADFDTISAVFSGTLPTWAEVDSVRVRQPGAYDVEFYVRDDVDTVSTVLSIEVGDSLWTPGTMAECVADRPISAGGEIGTPVALRHLEETTFWSSYGGGRTLRRVSFGFTSQVPDVEGWEEDWATEANHLFLPPGQPAAHNVGAVVEGCYAQGWGIERLAEQACAELDLPVLIIDCDWAFTYPGSLMTKYNAEAQSERDPELLFYMFSTAHYLRAADALVSALEAVTDWPVSHADFRVALTGHSKFGQTCYAAAAADSHRVAAIMSSGASGIDKPASRLLATLQGAVSINPGASPTYLGSMTTHYAEGYRRQREMNPSSLTLVTEGTNDSRGTSEGYGAKYGMMVTDLDLALPHRVLAIPNLLHTTQSEQHSTVWRMLLAAAFLDRPMAEVTDVSHQVGPGDITVEATISGAEHVLNARIWATGQSDADTSAWDRFVDYPVTWFGNQIRGSIPDTATTYFVEVLDEVDGVRGSVTSAPMPVNRDYPLLPLAPAPVEELAADLSVPVVTLTWETPPDEDFAGTLVRFSPTHFPIDPLDGTTVYDGVGTSAEHIVGAGTRFYYAAFTYDALGFYGAPQLASVERGLIHMLEAPSTMTSARRR